MYHISKPAIYLKRGLSRREQQQQQQRQRHPLDNNYNDNEISSSSGEDGSFVENNNNNAEMMMMKTTPQRVVVHAVSNDGSAMIEPPSNNNNNNNNDDDDADVGSAIFQSRHNTTTTTRRITVQDIKRSIPYESDAEAQIIKNSDEMVARSATSTTTSQQQQQYNDNNNNHHHCFVHDDNDTTTTDGESLRFLRHVVVDNNSHGNTSLHKQDIDDGTTKTMKGKLRAAARAVKAGGTIIRNKQYGTSTRSHGSNRSTRNRSGAEQQQQQQKQRGRGGTRKTRGDTLADLSIAMDQINADNRATTSWIAGFRGEGNGYDGGGHAAATTTTFIPPLSTSLSSSNLSFHGDNDTYSTIAGVWKNENSNRTNLASISEEEEPESFVDLRQRRRYRTTSGRWTPMMNRISSGLDPPTVCNHNDIDDGMDHDEQQQGFACPEDAGGSGGGSPLLPVTVLAATAKIVSEFQELNRISRSAQLTFRAVLLMVMSALGISAILFYHFDNPPTGILANHGKPINGTTFIMNEDGIDAIATTTKASTSWWILFIFVRQVMTLSFACGTESFIITFLSIRTKFMSKCMGPFVTLFLIQAKGWPFILFMWGIYDYLFLCGTGSFANHWLYWQSEIRMFNASNPAGNVVDKEIYKRLILSMTLLGIVVALKRLWLGIYLGRQTFVQYSDQLSSVMKKMLLISQVGTLGLSLESDLPFRQQRGMTTRGIHLPTMIEADLDDSISMAPSSKSERTIGLAAAGDSHNNNNVVVIDRDDRNPLTGLLSARQKERIAQLLGDWEEPGRSERAGVELVSIDALLQFRRAMAFLQTDFPFSGGFGLAGTREEMIESAQDLYARLIHRNQVGNVLSFETIAVIAAKKDDTLDQEKMKDLIRLFRPDREGNLSLVDFVKSIDGVYRQLRMLGASVVNSGRMDLNFENIFNWIFYTLVATAIIGILGFNPLQVFLSISGVLVAFAFVIGSAAARYFDGVLLVLQRPYDIGDRIHVSDIQGESVSGWPMTWLVEDLTLSVTTVLNVDTNERATLSNGALAQAKIINYSRSDPANLRVLLKFPVDVSYEKLGHFEKALRDYVKNRPREWREFICFLATRVEADQGFIEYIIVAGHRETWDKGATLFTSRANLSVFALELSKELGIEWTTSSVPVDLTIKNNQQRELAGTNQDNGDSGASTTTADLVRLQAMFAPDSDTVV